MTPDQAELLRQRLLQRCEDEHRLTMVAIDALPADKIDWKPEHEKCWTAGALAEHAMTASSFFVCQVTGKHPAEGPPPPAATKEEVVARATAAADAFMETLRTMPVEKLGEDLDFGGQSFPAIDVLGWHPWHMVHHRGQLLLYLRIMGARVPSTYGPSGDEPPPG
jgi:uncharacterized damage-inducible protein DinB